MTIKILPAGVTYTHLKRVAAMCAGPGRGGDDAIRQCVLLGGIADMVAREAVKANAECSGALYYAKGAIYVVNMRLARMTEVFVREAYGEAPQL